MILPNSLEKTIKKIYAMEFNARDYYPQGPEAWLHATIEYRERILKLESVADDLVELAMHCSDHIDEQNARRAERL